MHFLHILLFILTDHWICVFIFCINTYKLQLPQPGVHYCINMITSIVAYFIVTLLVFNVCMMTTPQPTFTRTYIAPVTPWLASLYPHLRTLVPTTLQWTLHLPTCIICISCITCICTLNPTLTLITGIVVNTNRNIIAVYSAFVYLHYLY